MAKDITKEVTASTGAVTTPTEPQVHSQAADQTSTGAAEIVTDGAGEISYPHHGAPAEVRFPTPTEPEVIRLPMVSDDSEPVVEGDDPDDDGQPKAKVVTTAEPDKPAGSRRAQTKG